MQRLSSKTVLITGASSGIGEACAFEYAEYGSNLIICARRTSKLLSLQNQLLTKFPTIKVHSLTLDVTDRVQVFESINNLPSEFKNIDILVNNAGLALGVDKIELVEIEKIDQMFNTNVKGVLNMTQAVLPTMKKNERGSIVMLNSIAGIQAYPGGSGYCASKHALSAITNTLRHELISTPINVISIEPETEFSVIRFDGDKQKADSVYKGMTPLSGKDIAETICFATSRAPHVQIANMIVFPTNQSAATSVFRKE